MSEERDDDSPARRSQDLLGQKDSKLRKELVEVWNQVRQGFEDQSERASSIGEYWEAYHCELNSNQYYNGEAENYIPIIRDAVNARATRFSNQLFPAGGQYIESVSTDGSVNGPVVDLLHEYLEQGQVKTAIVKPLCKMGDIEGQYNVYVDWNEVRRQVVSRVTRPMEIEGIPVPGEEIDDIKTEDIIEGRPVAEVLHDSDVLIWPASADSVEEALQAGGGVAIVRRWSKGKVERLADAGVIRRDAADELVEMMKAGADRSSGRGAGVPPDVEKQLNELVGIRKKGTEATVWEVWKLLPLNEKGRHDEDGGVRRLCQVFFGPAEMCLGCARNRYWNDLCPLLSRPVEKIPGAMKGRSLVEGVISLQYMANDAANRGDDVDNRTAMPVTLRDPASGNEPLILDVGSLWNVPPNSVKILEFPDMNPRAIAKIQYCIAQIFQSLGVNPSMLPQQTSQSRRNQAQIAQEQQVDLLTTAEMVGVIEEGILTPMVGWWVDLDYQFRDRALMVKTHGTMGVRVNMQEIPAFKTRNYYRFKWWGADQARFNAVQFQQMIAWMNVANSMGEQLARDGKAIDFTGILEGSAGAIFGPKYRGTVIKDLRAQWSIDPQLENQLLAQGDDVPVSPMDDHPKHLQVHMQGGHGASMHVKRHQIAMMAAAQAQAMQQMQAMMGPPGGGQPQPGAQVQPLRAVRGPPGSMHPDRMPSAGGIMMPRKF